MRHQEAVQRANRSVAQAVAAVDPTLRLHCHFQPPAYWMNDPNGLVYYQGYYHAFYQHNPYSPQWGCMHWGHARTKDFLTWEHLPIALAPSETYDRDGCFSGSAVVAHGALHLFYTGVRQSGGHLVQVQCRAVSTDGIHFAKDPRNPLIAGCPLEGAGDFRDPRVWTHDSSWYMAVGSGSAGRGKVLLYRSADLAKWQYVGIAAESDGSQGTVWECPDLFPLGDRHVLVVSPMGTNPRRVLYAVGDMDYAAGKFIPDSWGELDKGPDFYAAQTFFGAERRIMLAWMQAWESPVPSQDHNWAGAFTLPRELVLDSCGQLQVRPAVELALSRAERLMDAELTLDSGTCLLPVCDLRTGGYEVRLRIGLAGTSAPHMGLILSDAGGELRVVVGLRCEDLELYLDTTRAPGSQCGIYAAELQPAGDELEIWIFLDRCSIEISGPGKAASVTARVHPRCPQVVPEMFAEGGMAKANLQLWILKARS